MCFHLNKCLILLFITIGRCIGGGFQYFPYDNHNLRNNAIHPAFTIVEHYIEWMVSNLFMETVLLQTCWLLTQPKPIHQIYTPQTRQCTL